MDSTGYRPIYMVVEPERRRAFPLDMLRYDSAHPFEETDTNRIGRSLDNDAIAERILLRRFSRDGTSGSANRWGSFGWRVVGTFADYTAAIACRNEEVRRG